MKLKYFYPLLIVLVCFAIQAANAQQMPQQIKPQEITCIKEENCTKRTVLEMSKDWPDLREAFYDKVNEDSDGISELLKQLLVTRKKRAKALIEHQEKYIDALDDLID